MFLQSIADIYAERERKSLIDYCFVFPNRRSATFFRNYLIRAVGPGFIMPRIATIGELVAKQSPLREATFDEAIFNLYNAYLPLLSSDEGVSFDRFLFWGTMLLNDFDEVDANLVDADSLFTNIERWREIRSFYLTPEQTQLIERYWGEKLPSAADVDRFWQHIYPRSEAEPQPEDEGMSPQLFNCASPEGEALPAAGSFLRLWQILAPLYHAFRERLAAAGLATQGMMMRQLVNDLNSLPVDEVLPAKRYIFIGFDIPTLGETTLFSRLHAAGRADFYWDFNSPVATDSQSRLSSIMRSLRTDFPSRYPVDAEPRRDFPSIELIGVPSETGQAKLAGDIINSWVNDSTIDDPKNAISTAVVLPDEALFVPMVHAIPESITSMNVTMGYPLRFTPIASLIGSITSLHMRSRSPRSTDVVDYFYQDIEALITNPLLHAAVPDACDALLTDIRTNRRYNLSASYICTTYPALAPIFVASPPDGTAATATAYLRTLLSFLSDALAQGPNDQGASAQSPREGSEEVQREACSRPSGPAASAQSPREKASEAAPQPGREEVPSNALFYSAEAGAEEGPSAPQAADDRLQTFFLRACANALDSLTEAIERFGVIMRESTFLHLLERMLFNATVRFEGEPLGGLQLMGVLETRALEFSNVIITSMNERVFPKKSYVRSFIPDALRSCFGLPTPAVAEARYAYYFYRLISHARNVRLLYDTRSGGTRNNEVSRFVVQLIYLYPGSNVRLVARAYPALLANPSSITIPKSPDILARLAAYTSSGPKPRNLSASALKTYLNCPLQFLLRYVMGMDVDNEFNDYMEQTTFGTIVHSVFERLYTSLPPSPATPVINPLYAPTDPSPVPIPPRQVTAATIQHWLKHPHLIEREITRAVNTHYSTPGTPVDAPLRGETLVLGSAMLRIIQAGLRCDLANTPFTFRAAEYEMRLRWPVSPTLTVNFKQVIDRIDCVAGRLRVVDYKTGVDETSLTSLDSLFQVGNVAHEKSAIFQVLLYCELLLSTLPVAEPVQPYIYNLHKVLTEGFKPISLNRKQLTDYATVRPEFTEQLRQLIAEIFDPSIPFTQTPDPAHCKYCPFRPLCARE